MCLSRAQILCNRSLVAAALTSSCACLAVVLCSLLCLPLSYGNLNTGGVYPVASGERFRVEQAWFGRGERI
jgi:hypothetical protein